MKLGIDTLLEKFGLDTVHEKNWFKSLAAIVAFIGVLLGVGSSAIAFLHNIHATGLVGGNGKPLPTVSAEMPAPAAAPAIVPVTPPPAQAAAERSLDDATKQKLLRILDNKGAGIMIACQRDDSEAKNYAQEIRSYLQSQGYAQVSLGYTNLGAATGLDISKEGIRAIIKVGRR